MKKLSVFILLFGILGLIIGYLYFGKIAGEYLSVNALFGNTGGSIGEFGRKLSGIQSIKQNIFISGGVGGVLGAVVYYLKKKK
ncbi:MAG: hypothetical protein JEZ09_16285 [Salinivirgaceae bacterium]|nr:hypothetical protein [Salinivirgaceae bacterium]